MQPAHQRSRLFRFTHRAFPAVLSATFPVPIIYYYHYYYHYYYINIYIYC